MELYCPDGQESRLFDVTRDEISANIIKLAQLGRSTKWVDRVSLWASMVYDDNSDLRWAFYQGLIYVNYAI